MAMLVFLNLMLFVGSLPMMRRMSLRIHLQALHVMGILDVCRHVFSTFLYALILVLERFSHLLVSLANTLADRIGHHLYQTVGRASGQSFVRLGDNRLHSACGLQPCEGCAFASTMDFYQ